MQCGPPTLYPAATPTSLQLLRGLWPVHSQAWGVLAQGTCPTAPPAPGATLIHPWNQHFQTFMTTGCSQKSTSYQNCMAFDIYIYKITLLCTLILSILFNLSWYKVLFATHDIRFLTQWVTSGRRWLSHSPGHTSCEALPSFPGMAWLLLHWLSFLCKVTLYIACHRVWLNVSVCIYLCVYISVCIYLYIYCVYVVCVCVSMCIRICMCACVCWYRCVCACRTCVFICVRVNISWMPVLPI